METSKPHNCSNKENKVRACPELSFLDWYSDKQIDNIIKNERYRFYKEWYDYMREYDD